MGSRLGIFYKDIFLHFGNDDTERPSYKFKKLQNRNPRILLQTCRLLAQTESTKAGRSR